MHSWVHSRFRTLTQNLYSLIDKSLIPTDPYGITCRLHSSYLSDIEIFAPGRSCHNEQTSRPLPRPTMGGVAALVSGHAVYCGGAVEMYAQCNSSNAGARM